MTITAGPQAPGSSHQNIRRSARDLQREGVRMYSIGLGPHFKHNEVLGLASYVDYVRYYGLNELPQPFFTEGKYKYKPVFSLTAFAVG